MYKRKKRRYLSIVSLFLSALLIWEPIGVSLANATNGPDAFLRAPSVFQDLSSETSPELLEQARVEIAFLLKMIKSDPGVPRQDLNARLDSWRANDKDALKSIEVLTDPQAEGEAIYLEFTFTSGEFAGERFVAVSDPTRSGEENTVFGFEIYSRSDTGASLGDLLERQDYSLLPPKIVPSTRRDTLGDGGKKLYSFAGLELLASVALAAKEGSDLWHYFWAGCLVVGITAFIAFTAYYFFKKEKPIKSLNLNKASEAELRLFLEKIWPDDRKERKAAMRVIMKARRKRSIRDLNDLKDLSEGLREKLAESVVLEDKPEKKGSLLAKTLIMFSALMAIAGGVGMSMDGEEASPQKQPVKVSASKEEIKYQKDKFFVFFTAHGDASDFEMMRPDLDRIVKMSAPDPTRGNMPNLILIHESILMLESVRRRLDEDVDTKNIFKLVYDPKYKESLRKAYEASMEYDRNYLESLDNIPHEKRVMETLQYTSMQGHSAYDRAYYKWAGYTGARQRSAELGFEDWYNAMRAQFDNSYDLALFRGDPEFFFSRFSYKVYNYLYGLKAIRDKAVVDQVAALRQEYPEANILYPVGFSHSTNKRIFSSAGNCEFLGGQDSGVAKGFSSRVTSRYSEKSFRGSQEEKDLLALLYLETAISNLFPKGVSMADITNMLDERFEKLKEKGINPSKVIVELSARLAPKKIPENEVIKTPVKFGIIVRELFKMGVIEETFYKKLGFSPENEKNKTSSIKNDGSLRRGPIEIGVLGEDVLFAVDTETLREAEKFFQEQRMRTKNIRKFLEGPRRRGIIPSNSISPSSIIVDLSLMPKEFEDEYAKTWAALIWSCRSYKKLNFIFKMPDLSVREDLPEDIKKNVASASRETDMVAKIKKEFENIAYRSPEDVDVDTFFNERINAELEGAVNIPIMSSSWLEWMKARGISLDDGEYPVAMRDADISEDGIFPFVNFEIALTMALVIVFIVSLRSERFANADDEKESSLGVSSLSKKIHRMYALSGQGVKFTEETLLNMGSSSAVVRMNLALATAIPPVARLDAQAFAEMHERILQVNFSA